MKVVREFRDALAVLSRAADRLTGGDIRDLEQALGCDQPVRAWSDFRKMVASYHYATKIPALKEKADDD